MAYYRLQDWAGICSDSCSLDELDDLGNERRTLAAERPVWCIFDNTDCGAGTPNGLDPPALD